MTAFSQRDPRWQDQQLGTGTLSIGQAGCLITCAASILADHGVGTDPGRLNDWLRANGGYVDGNLFVFNALTAYGLQLTDYAVCERIPAPTGKLTRALEAQHYVILMVDFSPGGAIQPHWVRLLDAKDWLIADPWRLPGKIMRDLSAYYAVGWDAARAIMRYVIYAPVTPQLRVVQHDGFDGEAQPFICVQRQS